jgi:hypothetical protein
MYNLQLILALFIYRTIDFVLQEDTVNFECIFARAPHVAAFLKAPSQSLAILVLLSLSHIANAQTVLPGDAGKTCIVNEDEFKRWFTDGNVKKDGEVKPAGSLSFQPASECAFYRWSEQMFLWLTSPLSQGRYKFNSSDFFAVDSPGSDGGRKLIRQDDPQQKGIRASIALVEKNPSVIVDSRGKQRAAVTLETPADALSPFLDKSNKAVDVVSIAASIEGKPLLLDRFNKALDFKEAANGAPAIAGPSAETVKLANETALVDGAQHLLTEGGAVVFFNPVATSQVMKDVLIARNGAIVYYLIQVNDVFAYFRIGTETNAIPTPQQLPSEASALAATEAFANTALPPDHKNSFGDRDAMAMQLKSSWIDLSALPDAARKNYLTVRAEIPIYATTGDKWRKQIGTKPADLGLVGFHVVGTALGHPEMIWATFEHVNNAPNSKYTYQTAGGQTVTREKDGPGEWLFSDSGATELADGEEHTSRAKMNGTDIVAAEGQTIGPVNVTRRLPWGSLDTNASPAAATNTKIIAINKNVLGQLADGDVRKNYLLVGAIWTNGTKPDKDKPGNQQGTTALANSTMETFRQTKNCFHCHQGSVLDPLSHVWSKIITKFPD